MKCKNCECYEPQQKLTDNLEPIKNEFERYGECDHEKHIVGDPNDYGLNRYYTEPPKGGIIATNGFYNNMASSICYVDEEYGCVNFKKKK